MNTQNVSAPFESRLHDRVPMLRELGPGWAAEEGWLPRLGPRSAHSETVLSITCPLPLPHFVVS